MCKLNYCKRISITPDGYCYVHKSWSQNKKYIIPHVEKYLNDVHKACGVKEKAKIVGKLFNYLKYKKEFINTYDNFKISMLKKCDEIEQSCNDYIKSNYSDNIQVFINCIDNIEKLRVNLEVEID